MARKVLLEFLNLGVCGNEWGTAFRKLTTEIDIHLEGLMMKLCRFDNDCLGLVEGNEVLDVTEALEEIPMVRWVRSMADPVIDRLTSIQKRVATLSANAKRYQLSEVNLEAPVALPSKIIGCPVNYHEHMVQALNDFALHQGEKSYSIVEKGCFLKAGSSLIGSGGSIRVPSHADRADHEAEVAVIIGKAARDVKAKDAYSYIAGYCLALDMTVRGKQERSMRKSCDGFAVVGPYLVTADEISESTKIPFELTVNGELRQSADTGLMVYDIPEIIEVCSTFYTLLPGDIIMTGTPAGVSPVMSGDLIQVTSPMLGVLDAKIL